MFACGHGLGQKSPKCRETASHLIFTLCANMTLGVEKASILIKSNGTFSGLIHSQMSAWEQLLDWLRHFIYHCLEVSTDLRE